MDVSFKGYQNIGARFIENSNSITCRLVAQITDEGSKDLSDWQSVLKTFPDPAGDNFVRIEDVVETDNVIGRPLGQYFKLNGKRVEVEDKNMPVFTKIAALLNKISNEALAVKTFNSPNPFPVKEEYAKSVQCLQNFNLPLYAGSVEVEGIHDLRNIRNAALNINESLSKVMEKFFTQD